MPTLLLGKPPLHFGQSLLQIEDQQPRSAARPRFTRARLRRHSAVLLAVAAKSTVGQDFHQGEFPRP
jgi:hypothetical protein